MIFDKNPFIKLADETVLADKSRKSEPEQSDDENFVNQMKGFEGNDKSVKNSEAMKENIEMIVIADNTNGNQSTTRTESIALFHSNLSNSNINDNNSNDCIERMAANNTTSSVIDLEVDVHHRNSSGSSIGISSEPSKSHSETINTSEIAVSNSPTLMTAPALLLGQNCEFMSELAVDLESNEFVSHLNSGSDMNITDDTESCERLKGTSLELGFMAQDPAVLRAQTNAANDPPSSRKRVDNIVRRARSELETTQCSADKRISSLPPSHPVSLEIIGTTRVDSSLVDASNDDNENMLRRTTPNLNENISMFSQQNKDCIKASNSPKLSSTKYETISSSPVLSEQTTKSLGEKEAHVLIEVETTQPKKPKTSDCDDGDESDVSLVVNFSAKVKKRKVQKSSKPRRTLNRRKVSKSCSSGKISMNKKCDKVLPFIDNTISSNELNKKALQICFSSESDIESSHNGSDSYTSRSSSLTSSHSSTSLNDETTPLTASLPPEMDNKSNASNSRNNSIALEPKCIAGPSKQTSYDNKSDLIKKLSEMPFKTESEDFVQNNELKVLRNELQRKRKSSKRMDPNASFYSQQSMVQSEPNNDLIAGASHISGVESSQNINADNGPPPYMLARILSAPGTHLAKSHEDTNIGA
ncbi:unnamed protein product, partial [Medioppia subpectinata]